MEDKMTTTTKPRLRYPPVWMAKVILAVKGKLEDQPVQGVMYVHGENREDARDRVRRIIPVMYPRVERISFSNTHKASQKELKDRYTLEGFPGLENYMQPE